MEPSTGGARFYSNILWCVSTQLICILQLILSSLNAICTYIYSQSSCVKQVWQLNQQGNYVLLTDIKDAYLHIPAVKCHHPFLHFIWQNKTYQWKVLPVGLYLPNASCLFVD